MLNMEYKNYSELSERLRELADIVDGFERQNYELGWCFALGAITAMHSIVQGKVDTLEETE